jgi:hypothetical protein
MGNLIRSLSTLLPVYASREAKISEKMQKWANCYDLDQLKSSGYVTIDPHSQKTDWKTKNVWPRPPGKSKDDPSRYVWPSENDAYSITTYWDLNAKKHKESSPCCDVPGWGKLCYSDMACWGCNSKGYSYTFPHIILVFGNVLRLFFLNMPEDCPAYNYALQFCNIVRDTTGTELVRELLIPHKLEIETSTKPHEFVSCLIVGLHHHNLPMFDMYNILTKTTTLVNLLEKCKPQKMVKPDCWDSTKLFVGEQCLRFGVPLSMLSKSDWHALFVRMSLGTSRELEKLTPAHLLDLCSSHEAAEPTKHKPVVFSSHEAKAPTQHIPVVVGGVIETNLGVSMVADSLNNPVISSSASNTLSHEESTRLTHEASNRLSDASPHSSVVASLEVAEEPTMFVKLTDKPTHKCATIERTDVKTKVADESKHHSASVSRGHIAGPSSTALSKTIVTEENPTAFGALLDSHSSRAVTAESTDRFTVRENLALLKMPGPESLYCFVNRLGFFPPPNLFSNEMSCEDAVKMCVDLSVVDQTDKLKALLTVKLDLPEAYKRVSLLENRYMSPPTGPDRSDVLNLLAHTALWHANCGVFGGYVRDYIMRGDKATDVDIHVNEHSENCRTMVPVPPSWKRNRKAPVFIKKCVLDHAARIIDFVEEHYGLHLCQYRSNGAADCFQFSFGMPGWFVEMDFIGSTDRTNQKMDSPGVDCDVGNLELRVVGDCLNLSESVPDIVPGEHISTIIQHCVDKSFVFFYDPSTVRAQTRLEKYFKKGWTCLTRMNQPRLGGLFKPEDKYSLKWWNRNCASGSLKSPTTAPSAVSCATPASSPIVSSPAPAVSKRTIASFANKEERIPRHLRESFFCNCCKGCSLVCLCAREMFGDRDPYTLTTFYNAKHTLLWNFLQYRDAVGGDKECALDLFNEEMGECRILIDIGYGLIPACVGLYMYFVHAGDVCHVNFMQIAYFVSAMVCAGHDCASVVPDCRVLLRW